MPMQLKTQIFSFCAECAEDAEDFDTIVRLSGIQVQVWTLYDSAEFPDVRVELKASASLERLLGLARKVIDGHVIAQTLRPVALTCNTLERDYGV